MKRILLFVGILSLFASVVIFTGLITELVKWQVTPAGVFLSFVWFVGIGTGIVGHIVYKEQY